MDSRLEGMGAVTEMLVSGDQQEKELKEKTSFEITIRRGKRNLGRKESYWRAGARRLTNAFLGGKPVRNSVLDLPVAGEERDICIAKSNPTARSLK